MWQGQHPDHRAARVWTEAQCNIAAAVAAVLFATFLLVAALLTH